MGFFRAIWCRLAHHARWKASAGGDWVQFYCPECHETWSEPR